MYEKGGFFFFKIKVLMS